MGAAGLLLVGAVSMIVVNLHRITHRVAQRGFAYGQGWRAVQQRDRSTCFTVWPTPEGWDKVVRELALVYCSIELRYGKHDLRTMRGPLCSYYYWSNERDAYTFTLSELWVDLPVEYIVHAYDAMRHGREHGWEDEE